MNHGGEKPDLYAALGVPRSADVKAIQKAYRRLARQYHPDLKPGDAAAEERFKQISQAYSVLSDPEKRRDYDDFGGVSLDSGFDAEAARRARAHFGGGGAGAFPGGAGGGFSFGDIDEIFGQMFAGRGRARSRAPRPRRGRDLETEITLDFLEAARGGEHRISLERPAADGSRRREQLAIRIPPGVADGGSLRLAGKGGESPSGGPPGDLHLNLRVRPHPVLRREGRDLHLEVPIGISQAVLGARIEVPTLEGRASVTVPEGTDSGCKLRLRGKGIPDPKGGPAGDLLVTIQIRVPRGLDAEVRAKFEELAEFDPPDLRKERDA